VETSRQDHAALTPNFVHKQATGLTVERRRSPTLSQNPQTPSIRFYPRPAAWPQSLGSLLAAAPSAEILSDLPLVGIPSNHCTRAAAGPSPAHASPLLVAAAGQCLPHADPIRRWRASIRSRLLAGFVAIAFVFPLAASWPFAAPTSTLLLAPANDPNRSNAGHGCVRGRLAAARLW